MGNTLINSSGTINDIKFSKSVLKKSAVNSTTHSQTVPQIKEGINGVEDVENEGQDIRFKVKL